MDEFDCWVLKAEPLAGRLAGPVVVTMLLVPRGDERLGPGRAFGRPGRPRPAFGIDIEPGSGGISQYIDGLPQARVRMTHAWREPFALSRESERCPVPGRAASSGVCRIGRTRPKDGGRRQGFWHRVTAFLNADFV